MNALTIKRFLSNPDGFEATTGKELLDDARRRLDKAIDDGFMAVFVADDGKTYALTVEAVIEEADPDFVRGLLDGEVVALSLDGSSEWYHQRCYDWEWRNREYPNLVVHEYTRAWVNDQESVVHCDACGLPL